MPLSSEALIEQLKEDLEAKKAFHQHPWIEKFARGELSREQVKIWTEQLNYVTGIGIHELMGGIYAKCTDPESRKQIADSLYEEETGKMSGTEPHPELYIRLGIALGSSREEMLNVKPLPETRAVRAWYELADSNLAQSQRLRKICSISRR